MHFIMNTNIKPPDVRGMDGTHIPVRIFACDNDLSSVGKLILCSRKQKHLDDVVYLNRQWVMRTLRACLVDCPDVLGRVTASLDVTPI